MSIKETIITNILLSINNVSNEVKNIIENTLVIELGKYNISEKCTDIIVEENNNERLLKRFCATKRLEGLSESTIKRYIEQNKKMLDFIMKDLDEISTDDIRYYLATIKQEHHLSNNTVDGLRRCISSLFSWLTSEELIDKNPCLKLHKIKFESKVKQPFTDDEMNCIRKACKSDRDSALVEFLYSTGARVSEVSALKICDIDLEHKEYIVHGKGNKERYVYLSNECLVKLHTYLSGVNIYSNDSLFGLTKNGIENVVNRIGRDAGVKAYPHKFRRTTACKLLCNGMDIYSVSRVLGHSNLNTTSIYLNMSNQKIRDEFQKCMN